MEPLSPEYRAAGRGVGASPTERPVASFEGGAIASEAGALLLGGTDQAAGLVRRFAACFTDARNLEQIEHVLATRSAKVAGIALGYEDLFDHDQLRHDPVLPGLVGKLEARRMGWALLVWEPVQAQPAVALT